MFVDFGPHFFQLRHRTTIIAIGYSYENYVTLQTVMTFLQQDVTQGRVSYVHNGREIGKMPQRDLATIMVSDRRGKFVIFWELLDILSSEAQLFAIEEKVSVTILSNALGFNQRVVTSFQ